MRRLAFLVLALLAGAAWGKEVAVDVGHYLAEPGAISARGVPEFQYNLHLAAAVKAALVRAGFVVRMIGERGDYSELGARTRAARGADFFLSIHHDSAKARLLKTWTYQGRAEHYGDRFSGFSLFISHENPYPQASLACAAAIGARLRAAGFHPSRYHADPVLGEGRPFADEKNGVHWFDHLAVARSATMPAALLEAGVIVNRAEELRLREPRVERRIARAVAQGLRSCLR
ncbi:MAG: N-acetylmuramoyl-L-alanine amidase [Betaproteobacteria bacterium]|nr:N-acetylmuramoyl-L-alanine amidase [Betaproteobacteria bacterium]